MSASKKEKISFDCSYFSVSFDLVRINSKIPFDIYINSSGLKYRERFVRIFPKGSLLEKDDLDQFIKKYHQLYIPEDQREQYLQCIMKEANLGEVHKTEAIKDVAINYLDKLFNPEKEFNTEILENGLEGCRSSIKHMVEIVKNYDIDDIQNIIGELSYHDFYTYDHSINVAMYSIVLYKAAVFDAREHELMRVGLGGLLHDIGKIKIPTRILNSPDDLSDDEFSIMKKHPAFGIELLDEHECHSCKELDLNAIKRIILEHHENYNGTGYPQKLKGDKIDFMARVVAIADFFDAITTKRSYHEVLSTGDAIEVMTKSIGKKIDPALFKIFLSKIKGLVMTGKKDIHLDDDFDPCRPQNVLPFKKIVPEKQDHDLFDKKDDFGEVKEYLEDLLGQKDKRKIP